MITVNKFQVSTDRLSIDVEIAVASTFLVTSLDLWNEGTYKTPALAVDLDSKIVGTDETEAFTITAAEAGVTSFDGLYFMEIESNDPSDVPGIVGTMSLTRYYAVIARLLCNVDLSCLNCNDNAQNVTLLDLYVEAMKNAILLGRFRDAIEYLTKINIFEEFSCSECDTINPVVSTAGNIVSVGVVDCILALTP